MARFRKKDETVKEEPEKKTTRKRRTKKDEPPTAEEYKEQGMTPSEYFEYVKSKKQEITDEELLKEYENIERLAMRFSITNQVNAVKKLRFLQKCIDLEVPIIKAGYNHFVYRQDVERFIKEISDKCVFIKRLSEYEREIPDEVLDEVIKAKEVFGDYLWVLFTDYTKKEAKKVAKERREKDPILFGGISVENKGKKIVVLDRLYYICDWVDESCDLTLEEFVKKYNEIHPDKNDNIVKNVVKAGVPDVLNSSMNRYQKNEDDEVDPAVEYIDTVGTSIIISNSYEINSITQRIPEENDG